jgi:hypothetical protein
LYEFIFRQSDPKEFWEILFGWDASVEIGHY